MNDVTMRKTLACGEEHTTTNFYEECLARTTPATPVENPFGSF